MSEGTLKLTDTIGQLLPGRFPLWQPVTLAQLLHHTSGVPDYIKNPAFIAKLQADPLAAAAPQQLLTDVAGDPLMFPPGSRYAYSDSDNIVVGWMVEAATHQPYETVLDRTVLSPLSLPQTKLPSTVALASPVLRGYDVEAGHPPEDATAVINPTLAWASGGMVSTPSELNRFISAYVSGHLFNAATRAQQLQFVPGGSGPPGPGANAAGLAIFRYQTSCGAVYGHTGNIPGYTVFAASSPDGKHSAIVVVNTQLNNTTTPVFQALQRAEDAAVCSSGAT